MEQLFKDLRRRVERLEAEVRALKNSAGAGGTAGQDGVTDDWLYSSESIAEYKAAIRHLALYHDKKPLERYCEKTDGRVPRTLD